MAEASFDVRTVKISLAHDALPLLNAPEVQIAAERLMDAVALLIEPIEMHGPANAEHSDNP